MIEHYGGRCMACGRCRKHHGVIIHVDHIKPRHRYPHLSLDFNNLQILCEDCNIGKGWRDMTDWRPEQKRGMICIGDDIPEDIQKLIDLARASSAETV